MMNLFQCLTAFVREVLLFVFATSTPAHASLISVPSETGNQFQVIADIFNTSAHEDEDDAKRQEQHAASVAAFKMHMFSVLASDNDYCFGWINDCWLDHDPGPDGFVLMDDDDVDDANDDDDDDDDDKSTTSTETNRWIDTGLDDTGLDDDKDDANDGDDDEVVVAVDTTAFVATAVADGEEEDADVDGVADVEEDNESTVVGGDVYLEGQVAEVDGEEITEGAASVGDEEIRRHRELVFVRTIQRYVRSKLVRINLARMAEDRNRDEILVNAAAIKVQCLFRRMSAKAQLGELKAAAADCTAAATKLQCLFRRMSAKAQLGELKAAAVDCTAAATKLQCLFRRLVAKAQLDELKAAVTRAAVAATKLQRLFRRIKAAVDARMARKREAEQDTTGTAMEPLTKHTKVVHTVVSQPFSVKALVRIQSWVRRIISGRQLRISLNAAIKIQSRIRCHLTKLMLNQEAAAIEGLATDLVSRSEVVLPTLTKSYLQRSQGGFLNHQQGFRFLKALAMSPELKEHFAALETQYLSLKMNHRWQKPKAGLLLDCLHLRHIQRRVAVGKVARVDVTKDELPGGSHPKRGRKRVSQSMRKHTCSCKLQRLTDFVQAKKARASLQASCRQPVGIPQHQNKCFLNSTLQALAACGDTVSDYLIEAGFVSDEAFELFSALGQLRSGDGNVDHRKLLPSTMDDGQQEGMEWLMQVLPTIEEETDVPSPFSFIKQSIKKCCKCGCVRDCPMMKEIVIPVVAKEESKETKIVDSYFSSSKLEDLVCNKCGRKDRHKEWTDRLVTTPDILVLDKTGLGTENLDEFIELSPKQANGKLELYKLMAVTVYKPDSKDYQGNPTTSGHYMAYRRGDSGRDLNGDELDSSAWFEMNDLNVEQWSFSAVERLVNVRSLFYKKTDRHDIDLYL